MNLKRVSAFLLMLIMMFSLSINVVYAADELSFKTGATLPNAVSGSSYSTKVEAQGGTAPYTYKLNDNSDLPQGLTLSSNGTISGTPTEGGVMFCDIQIVATDADNNSVIKKFIMTVEAIPVVFEITNNVYVFDGNPHKATIVTKVNGRVVTDVDYTVTYGGSEEQTAAGMYPIDIKINTPGYSENYRTASHLYINKNEDIIINFSGSSYIYNGSPQGPTAEVKGGYPKAGTDPTEYEWRDLQHTLIYEGLNVNYNSAGTAPTLPGRYFVSCRIDEQGFRQYPPNNTAEFEILKAKVDFNLEGQNLPYNQGESWTGTYTPSVNGVSATVKYVKNGIEYDTPNEAGTYTVNITLNDNDKYETGNITPSSISVGKQTVHFSAGKKSAEYNDCDYSAEVTNDAGLTEGTDYEVVYYNSQNEQAVPHNADTYTFDINFLNGKDEQYEKAEIIDNTFEITKKPVTFTIYPNGFLYHEDEAGQPIPAEINITTNPAGFTGYTVSYENDETKEVSETISEKGRYNVIYTITDNNYKIGTPNTNVVSIGTEIINYTFTNLVQVYDKQPKSVNVESDPNIPEDKYRVVYSQNGTEVVSPTNVGVYGVSIHPVPSYTTGTKTPEIPTLTITARPVTFTAESTTYTYDGKPHNATVTTDDTVISSSEYKVQYRDNKGNLSDNVTKSGTYDIIVTLTDPNNKNYTITSPSDKLVINENIRMALGNSPAAMIYKDSRYSDTSIAENVLWRENTFNSLKNNRKFSGDNVPMNCTADIIYSKVEGIEDFDVNEYTVIVNNIANYNDPGLMVDDNVPYTSTPVKVDGADNLYTVTYEYNGTSYTRYVVVINRIGDVNGDKSVNAVDANNLDRVNITSPTTINQARVWDVNKDGKIDSSDAEAIRKRFKTKLTPYYPWIN